MIVNKALSRLSDLVLILSHASSRGQLPPAPRRMHQAVARSPLSRTASVPSQKTEVPSETVDVLLAEHARRGNIPYFESLVSRIRSAPPTEHQRDLHVKAHVVNASINSSPHPTVQRFPTGALAVLHHYEASGHFAPIKSYTRVISALFNVQTCASSDPRLGRAVARAQAWDLFAHMRYVAHPIPDAHLYALMIRACGSFSRPEPERALDLWMEMQENGVNPTKGAYEAVIRVCGRAGPEWLGEGIRLAREMNEHGRGLWCALLEGCKRTGDLKRARWILAEAVRCSGDPASSEDSTVDAELMTHVFHTYASYKPPFRRETTRLIDHSAASNEVSANDAQVDVISTQSGLPCHTSTERTKDGFPDVPIENEESIPSFSRLPPQTSSDVIAEARALFDRILQDRSLSLEEACGSPQGGLLVGRFAHVKPTPVLFNAYLSVFYRHASIETSQEIFNFLFNKSDPSSGQIHPDEHSYINALEMCAIARVKDRYTAARWAKDIWQHWEVIEESGVRDGKVTIGSFARLIEKAHAAMRRILVQSGDIDGAQALLRSFVSCYPPIAVLQPTDSQPASSSMAVPIKSRSKSAIIQNFSKLPILSTRALLTNPVSSTPFAARPLVRLASVASPKDDRVPPIVMFTDVELLHTRLVEHGRTKDLGYVKWVCMAYSNALKKRRDAILKATPTRHEVD